MDRALPAAPDGTSTLTWITPLTCPGAEPANRTVAGCPPTIADWYQLVSQRRRGGDRSRRARRISLPSAGRDHGDKTKYLQASLNPLFTHIPTGRMQIEGTRKAASGARSRREHSICEIPFRNILTEPRVPISPNVFIEKVQQSSDFGRQPRWPREKCA
jgi:hypothetical protein